MAPIVGALGSTARMTPARYSHGTLRKSYADRLVHIGDAAHRASPQLGQGANIALLDALAVQTEGTDAGPLYVRPYQAVSALFTPQCQSGRRVLPVIHDRLPMPLSQMWPVPRILTRLVGGDLILPLAGVDFPPRTGHAGGQP